MANNNIITGKEVVLISRPDGPPKENNFEIRETNISEPGPGKVLVRSLYLSLDPYMRGRMSAGKSYTAPVQLGDVMGGGVVGEVLISNSATFLPGDIVTGDLGWRTHSIASSHSLRKIDERHGPISYGVSVLGMPGMTAYFGLLEVGKPKPGDTVFVSAASGAVGSLVGQIAKISGCRVIGTVSSEAKRAYCLNQLGFDEVINYQTCEDLNITLSRLCQDGIDINFENVGGSISDIVMQHLAFKSRVVVCGMISEYNLRNPYIGPSCFRQILINRVRVEGFLVTDWGSRWPEGIARMAKWLQDGKIVYKEDIIDGLEAAPAGLIGLLEGRNFGKMLVRIAERSF